MTISEPLRIGGILLAAGGSARLGTPKQHLLLDGVSLIRRAGLVLTASVCSPLIAVLGAEAERSRAEIDDLPLQVIDNPDWQTGMSSSIKTGLHELLRIEPDLAAVVITLCDQPLVTSDHINALASHFRESGPAIVAAAYGDTFGVPALFSREMFPRLLELSGDKGARMLIRSHPDRVESVPIPEAAFDVDTPADLAREPSLSGPSNK